MKNCRDILIAMFLKLSRTSTPQRESTGPTLLSMIINLVWISLKVVEVLLEFSTRLMTRIRAWGLLAKRISSSYLNSTNCMELWLEQSVTMTVMHTSELRNLGMIGNSTLLTMRERFDIQSTDSLRRIWRPQAMS